jgi:hypothetical protein
MSVAPFPAKAEEARVLLESAVSLLVRVRFEEDAEVYDRLADLVCLAAWACSEPPKTKRIEKACWHLRGGRD